MLTTTWIIHPELKSPIWCVVCDSAAIAMVSGRNESKDDKGNA